MKKRLNVQFAKEVDASQVHNPKNAIFVKAQACRLFSRVCM
jgi:hypothetical protein